jgi:hypothetical protein
LAAALGPTGLLRFMRLGLLLVCKLTEEEYTGPGSLLLTVVGHGDGQGCDGAR